MKRFLRFFGIALVSLLSVLTIVPDVTAAPPENFQVEQIIGSGLNGPSGFEIAPDGRIFILQRTGEIKIYKDGQLLPENFAVLPSVASGDRGLIGIAFDPAFGIDNHYVYFYYTGLDLRNRLVRFSASTDIGQNPFVIYQTNSPSQELHVGGSIRFGPDGKMYFAVGDNGYPPNAQNLNNPHGKILRINKDGSIPVDNPFFGQPGALPEIWAYGMRNPWRFQFDSATGRMYGGDVGDYTWEEVNLIVKGGNYGWPAVEGMCTVLCNYINPIYAYNHDGMSSSVTGGPIYRSTLFPEEYQGDLFFGDYARGFIRGMNLDEAGNNTGVYDFDANAGSVVDLKVASDGSLYYITYWPGRLYRVSYNPDNNAPKVNATADVTKGLEPLTVNFSSEGTYDPDEDPITYLWDFGDGTTSTEPNPTKTYTEKGTYTIDLAVSDGTYTSHAVPISIQVGTPPQLTVGAPIEGETYRAGDEISITAHAIDAAGFDLNDADIKTEIFLGHDTHYHPFLGPLTGRAHSFIIPDHGEASANTWYEIRVTATDGSGLSDTKIVKVYPIKTEMTFTTNIPGLAILLDGSPHDTPHTVMGVENFKREISTPTVQEVDGQFYVFDHWSDGGTQRHQIITPADDTTYTAYFRPANIWNATYYNNTELAGDPVLTREEAKIDHIWGEGSPDPAVNQNEFSARYTKEEYFAGGTYTFVAATDDGVRVYVDGQIVIDEWHGGNAAYNGEVTITPGMHEVTMEYFEGFGTATARLDWELAADQTSIPPSVKYDAEYFDNVTLAGDPVVTRKEDAVNYDWAYGSPDALLPIDGFSARFTKTEFLPSGMYTFTVTADDGFRVYLDGNLILDQWIDQGATEYTVEVPVQEGEHTIRVEYYENTGGALLLFGYQKTAELPVTDGFTAEYFDNVTLSGDPVITTTEEAVNFDWGVGSPDEALPIDNFSARFTKNEAFAEGTYEFAVTADDGVRLYIDGALVLDKWIDQAPTTYKVIKTLTEGTHEIMVEYYEKGGGAVVNLSYTQTQSPEPTEGFIGEYFNNMTLLAPVALTRTDQVIDFDWAGASPDPLINANNFSVRWTKNHTFTEAGTYEFTVTADDGVRLLIDGEVVIDQWVDQAATTYKVQKTLTAGTHTIVMEYYENGGGALAKMNFAKVVTDPDPDPEPGADYTAKFWNIPGGTEVPEIPVTAPDVTRIDTTIDFDWQDQSPADGINPGFFVAQWTKAAEFEDGTYTFTTTSDDGIRVFIDGELILDQWNDHAATVHTVQKVMTAGTHTIRVEYYEKWGDAVAKFSYTKDVTDPDPDPEPDPEPGADYTAKFWNIPGGTEVPEVPATSADVTRIDTEINFDWKDQAPAEGINPGFFVARWVKTTAFEDGTYTFTTTSDDGIRVYIDDELILDQWNDHAATVHTVEKAMTAGNHTIRVEYYEKWGDAIAKFSYTKGASTPPPAPTEQPEITAYVYNDGLENNWVNWSWDSVVDFAAALNPFSGTSHITFSSNNQWAGLYLHSDTGFDTTGYKEITFVVRATKANQKAELTFFDDANEVIGTPLKLSDYGGEPTVGEYKIYVIPLADLDAVDRVINGFHIKDVSGEMTNEIYVDSIGFTAL